MLHDERHEDRKQRDHRIEHGDAARLVKIVLAEEREIAGEHDDEEEDEERLTDDSGGKFVFGGTASLHFFFKRCEHPIVGRCDDFTPVDDFLTAHHHSASQRNAAQQIGLLRF